MNKPTVVVDESEDFFYFDRWHDEFPTPIIEEEVPRPWYQGWYWYKRGGGYFPKGEPVQTSIGVFGKFEQENHG